MTLLHFIVNETQISNRVQPVVNKTQMTVQHEERLFLNQDLVTLPQKIPVQSLIVPNERIQLIEIMGQGLHFIFTSLCMLFFYLVCCVYR